MRYFILLLLLVACAQPQLAPLPERITSSQEPLDNAELKNLLLKGIDGSEYRVTLAVSVTGTENFQSTTDVYVKGKRSRVDSIADFDGERAEARILITDDIINCINEGGWDCVSYPLDQEYVSASDRQMRTQLENASFFDSVSELPDRQLAGVAATCYLITMPDVEQEQCFSQEGAILYQAYTVDGNRVVHEATAYATTVSDSVFTPPATPTAAEN